VLGVVLAAYAWADHRLPEGEARAFAFATLVVANLALILSNRSRVQSPWAALRTPNLTLWIVVALALALLALVLYLPAAANLLHFARLPLLELLMALGLGLGGVAATRMILHFALP
jgi:Ca2+-transporting ATPase